MNCLTTAELTSTVPQLLFLCFVKCVEFAVLTDQRFYPVLTFLYKRKCMKDFKFSFFSNVMFWLPNSEIFVFTLLFTPVLPLAVLAQGNKGLPPLNSKETCHKSSASRGLVSSGILQACCTLLLFSQAKYVLWVTPISLIKGHPPIYLSYDSWERHSIKDIYIYNSICRLIYIA